MTFRFLPIEFDPQGLGRLRIDPVTRTSGQLTLEVTIDFASRRVVEAEVERRGVWRPERMVVDRAPSDAAWLMSRARGQGSAAHAIAAVMALEMAYEVAPPPLAIATRGLGAAAELIAIHTRQLFLAAGPDYSEAAISRTSMALWRAAQGARAAGHIFHGYRTIADIMRGMNPIVGHLYRESLHLTRVACEIATLLFGKYPHPSAIFPAGVGIVADRELYQQVLGRFNRLLDYAKKVTAVWDDLTTFLIESDARFGESGRWSGGLVSVGLWDDPQLEQAAAHLTTDQGRRRYSTPGVIIDGQLRVGDLPAIRDFLGTPSRPHLEAGPLARLWSTALAGRMRNEFIECRRHDGRSSLMFDLPKFQTPATFLAWQVPDSATTLERNRARAYQIAYASLVALTYLLRSFETLARGGKAMSKSYRLPEVAQGTSLWEEPAGSIIHHLAIGQLAIGGRRLQRYRVDTPETWLQAASDPPRRLGAIEQALINTPLVEEFSGPETFTGIDLLRVIRGFDC